VAIAEVNDGLFCHSHCHAVDSSLRTAEWQSLRSAVWQWEWHNRPDLFCHSHSAILRACRGRVRALILPFLREKKNRFTPGPPRGEWAANTQQTKQKTHNPSVPCRCRYWSHLRRRLRYCLRLVGGDDHWKAYHGFFMRGRATQCGAPPLKTLL